MDPLSQCGLGWLGRLRIIINGREFPYWSRRPGWADGGVESRQCLLELPPPRKPLPPALGQHLLIAYYGLPNSLNPFKGS